MEQSTTNRYHARHSEVLPYARRARALFTQGLQAPDYTNKTRNGYTFKYMSRGRLKLHWFQDLKSDVDQIVAEAESVSNLPLVVDLHVAPTDPSSLILSVLIDPARA